MYVYLGLGTNLGNKEQNLRLAVQYIGERIGKIISLSAFYATDPWGFTSDNTFLNAAVSTGADICFADYIISANMKESSHININTNMIKF